CLELAPKNPTVGYALACVEARAGKTEAALELLERAVAWGYPDAAVALWDQDLASLRSSPRFAAAVRDMDTQVTNRRAEGWVISLKDASVLSGDVAVDPKGKFAVVGMHDGTLMILDGRSGQRLRTLPSLGSQVWAMDLNPTGERAAVLTWDGNL